MKKLLILGLVLLLLPVVLAEQDCQLAVPRYGVVECYDLGSRETINMPSFEHYDAYSITAHPCISDCETLDSVDTIKSKIQCGSGEGLHFEVKVDNVPIFTRNAFGFGDSGSLPVKTTAGHEISFYAYCKTVLGGYKPIPSSSQTPALLQNEIMLKEGWAGTLPTTTISNTQGCTLNKVLDKYKDTTDVGTFIDPENSDATTKKPVGSTYNLINEMPTNWKVGENYIFVKDWQTGIADISLTYDKNNKGYWCGGQAGSRKIYSINEVTSATGKCYAVPTSIALPNVECCFPGDCLSKGATYTCNPDTWKCEETRWCDSDLNCQQVFGEGVCQNKQIIGWSCNFNKKWGDHTGTCEKTTKTVSQCPSDCTSDEYYNEEEGTCKSRNVLLECPAGKCCVAGRSYKEKSCSWGKECCITSGSYVGECKDSCTKEESKLSDSGGGSKEDDTETSGFGASSTAIYAVIIILGVGGAIFAIKKFGLIKKLKHIKKEAPEEKEHKEPKKKETKHCTNCGAELDKWDKFCTGCGEKA